MSFWVFAYGSLMWNPDIPVAETVLARLSGYARSFCLRSRIYRGTPDAPGLVLGLDKVEGAVCNGVALRVEASDWEAAITALREREMSTAAYHEELLPVNLRDGRKIGAVAYVMRRDAPDYVRLPDLEQARIIARAHGRRGANADYLFNTVTHLDQMGLPDQELTMLAGHVRQLLAT